MQEAVWLGRYERHAQFNMHKSIASVLLSMHFKHHCACSLCRLTVQSCA